MIRSNFIFVLDVILFNVDLDNYGIKSQLITEIEKKIVLVLITINYSKLLV